MQKEAQAHLDFLDLMSKSQKKKTPVVKLGEETETNESELPASDKLNDDVNSLNNLDKIYESDILSSNKSSSEKHDDEKSNLDEEEHENTEKYSEKDTYEYDYARDFDSLLNSIKFKESEDMNEKKDILYQLIKDYGEESKGLWTMNTPLHELKYELQKRKNMENEEDNVQFIRQIIVVVLHVIEFLNKKVNILKLDGWANHVIKNLDSYKKSLRAIHLRYFRNRISDPVTELGWMIIGSMIVFHLSQKVISPSDVQQTKERAKPGHPNDSPFSGIDVSTIFNLFSKMA